MTLICYSCQQPYLMGWKPIETAPKDGTNILGFANGEITTVSWFSWKLDPADYNDKNGHWTLCVSGPNADDGEWWPSHWMPLPKPPYQTLEVD